MDFRYITLEDWYLSGEGGTAECFYNKHDDTKLLKLFKKEIDDSLCYMEYDAGKALQGMDINVPKLYELVRANDRLGIIFERIIDKKSIATMIKEDESRLEEMMEGFAKECKKLHLKECSSKLFQSKKDYYLNLVKESKYINEEDRTKLLNFVKSIPDVHTCIHGDTHIGNMLYAKGKYYWIDNGDFAYGHPYFDLGVIYYQSYVDVGSEFSLTQFHLPPETLRRCFDEFMKVYFDNPTCVEIEKIKAELEPFAALFLVFVFNIVRNDSDIKYFKSVMNSLN